MIGRVIRRWLEGLRLKPSIPLVALAVLAAGCGTNLGEDVPGTMGGLVEHHVPLKDGRTVVCVELEDYSAGGLSCDWNAR